MTTTTGDPYSHQINRREDKRCHSSSYIGQQKKAIRHGFGIYTYINGFFQYEGEWVDGKKHGLGKFSMKDGSYFKGEFKNGEIDGNGLRYFGLTGNKYTGTFCKGELHGQGIMEYKNGSVYEGSWDYNKRQGHGILKEKGGSIYDGSFYEHKKHGHGVQKYQNGDMYRGDWIQGYRQGHGYFETSDGTYYKGQWANDMMSGMGYMKHSSGIIYEGNWINGLPQALATKLVFVPTQETHYIEKEKSFKIEIQCHNDDKELIPEDPAVPDPPASVPEEMMIQKVTDGKVIWENLFAPTSCVIKRKSIPQETKKKATKNVPTGPKSKKDNVATEIDEKSKPKPKKDNVATEIDEKSNEFVIVAKDITEPPFMNQRLQTAFMKMKIYQPKKFARWQSARIISRLTRLKSSAMDKKQPTL